MTRLVWLPVDDDHVPFPDPESALDHPDGLLAVGGSLTAGRLIAAYRAGIFPWYTTGQPILWWSPNPRSVLFPDRIKVSRSLRKTVRRATMRVTLDRAFQQVIRACAAPRDQREGTWITPAMAAAYTHLHALGLAHSVEVWQKEQLVGGLYGVALGRAFFGESMFSRVSDASKVALVHLAGQLFSWGYGIIDCQLESAHLTRLGAERVPRRTFLRMLDELCDLPGQPAPWRMDEPAPIDLVLRPGGTRS
jgi:leucyl/phenylalanyl-tRNA--protein transferase